MMKDGCLTKSLGYQKYEYLVKDIKNKILKQKNLNTFKITKRCQEET